MRVKIIGCHGGTAPGYRTSCYHINDRFLIDAGSVCSALSPKKQFEINDIFITHPHIDHIKDLAFLVENTFRPERQPIVVHSTREILNDIHKHLFNNILWPDFTQIYVDPKLKKTLLNLKVLAETEIIDNLKIQHVRVNHPGNAIGFILDDGHQQLVFTGDTGPTEELWKLANQCSNLVGIFTEISFPTRMDSLARASGHFTTQQLLTELNKLNSKEVPIFISHFKPLFFEELMDEFHRFAPPRMKLLHQDDELVFE